MVFCRTVYVTTDAYPFSCTSVIWVKLSGGFHFKPCEVHYPTIPTNPYLCGAFLALQFSKWTQMILTASKARCNDNIMNDIVMYGH